MIADGILHQRPRAVRTPGENLVLCHQRSRGVDVCHGLIAHEADGHVRLTQPLAQSGGETIVKILPPPQELDAELQGRSYRAVKLRGRDAQMPVDEVKEIRGAALAHADDTETRTPHQLDAQGWMMRLQAGSHEETGSSSAKNEDILNHKGKPLG